MPNENKITKTAPKTTNMVQFSIMNNHQYFVEPKTAASYPTHTIFNFNHFKVIYYLTPFFK